MKIKVGYGYDVHVLEKGEELVIGGIKIEHHKGTIAHSDGDVLIHAICDALLGAANLRDIGFQFPDNKESLKGIDSKILLKNSLTLLQEKEYAISNIDTTIVLQRPKLKERIPEMQQVLAEVLNIDTEDISIKATTTEKLGFTGREEGIAAHAVVLIVKQ